MMLVFVTTLETCLDNIDSSIDLGIDSSLGSETRIGMKLVLIEVVEDWETLCRGGSSRHSESSKHDH